MTDRPAVIYLEADDEVTSVVRRLRGADPGPIVIVAPGRSRATSSVVALRLLARAAEADGRSLAVVGDGLTRSLAAEAGVAAHASLEEARRESDASTPPVPPQRAAINVVRGPTADDTAPTLPVGATSRSVGVDDATRPVPAVTAGPPPARARSRRPTRARRGRGKLVAVAAIVALLLAVTVAGAVLLPGATVTVRPNTLAIGPVPYEVTLQGVERLGGTVTTSTDVVATGTYSIVESATGAVTFRNFNSGVVEVPVGTLVAAGEQAFATTEAVAVPAGSLTADGRIAAGEAEAPVVASAAGPAANVPAEAIDTVLNDGIAAQLRAFPQNGSRLVINAAATSGGVDAAGPEITQADVDAAVATLRSDLADQVASAMPTDGIVVAGPPADPTITGLGDLVGRRDVERVPITGEIAWEAVRADRSQAEELGRERLLADADAVPEGHELLPQTIEVLLGEARVEGEELIVEVTVGGAAAPALDPDEIRRRIAGLPIPEAHAAVAELGPSQIELWPGWVSEVPDLDWRIDVRVEAPSPDASPVAPEPSG